MRHTEISDFDLAPVFRPQEIGRLDVPMDDPLVVH
jgi:hypothetical protein